jgi:internalin A
LTNLTKLCLASNRISDTSSLSSLTNLNYLAIGWNQISDISPLVENSGLGEGDTVKIQNNNLDLTEGSDDMQNIKTLQDRGVAVIY